MAPAITDKATPAPAKPACIGLGGSVSEILTLNFLLNGVGCVALDHTKDSTFALVFCFTSSS